MCVQYSNGIVSKQCYVVEGVGDTSQWILSRYSKSIVHAGLSKASIRCVELGDMSGWLAISADMVDRSLYRQHQCICCP